MWSLDNHTVSERVPASYVYTQRPMRNIRHDVLPVRTRRSYDIESSQCILWKIHRLKISLGYSAGLDRYSAGCLERHAILNRFSGYRSSKLYISTSYE